MKEVAVLQNCEALSCTTLVALLTLCLCWLRMCESTLRVRVVEYNNFFRELMLFHSLMNDILDIQLRLRRKKISRCLL